MMVEIFTCQVFVKYAESRDENCFFPFPFYFQSSSVNYLSPLIIKTVNHPLSRSFLAYSRFFIHTKVVINDL